MVTNEIGRHDVALLLTCLGPSVRWTSIRHMIGTWDMVDVGVPALETIKQGAAPLVGSGLAEVRGGAEVRLTDQGPSHEAVSRD